MEIIPGVGLPFVRVGQTRAAIEAAVGPAVAGDLRHASWESCTPPFEVYFDGAGRCELIEVYLTDDDAACRVTLEGVQLVGRRMSDVVADLQASGIRGRTTCLTVDYDLGFTLFSLDEGFSSHTGTAGSGVVVEGVAIGPPADVDGAVVAA